MHFISLELCLFIGVIFVYTRLRKHKIFPLEMVKGLTIYLPPHPEDFDTLETTNKPIRETAKGKVNKYDKTHVSKKAKFPMRTF